MARKQYYSFQRRERDTAKAAKRQEKRDARALKKGRTEIDGAADPSTALEADRGTE